MPVALKPLSKEETHDVFSRAADLSEYVAELRKLEAGQGALVNVDGQLSKEDRRRVVRTWNQAAKKAGLELRWQHEDGKTYLRVVGSPGDAAAQTDEAEEEEKEPRAANGRIAAVASRR